MAKRPLELEFDEIGYWSEVKLDILEKYAKPYNQILKKKNLKTVYVDAFAGAGHHVSKETGERIEGSPVRALAVQPAFDFLHFVDLNETRTDELRRLSQDHKNVTVHTGDANDVLPKHIFPQIRYQQYRRGLCILDPYGLHLDWELIQAAGQSRTIEIFLNFPVMDMNRNALWHDPEKVDGSRRERMSRFWGDDSWQQAAYSGSGNLFNYPEKQSNDAVASAFQKRLKDVAGFSYVPDPIPMRNTNRATVYYLFFAAHNRDAAKIVTDIFNKYNPVGG